MKMRWIFIQGRRRLELMETMPHPETPALPRTPAAVLEDGGCLPVTLSSRHHNEVRIRGYKRDDI